MAGCTCFQQAWLALDGFETWGKLCKQAMDSVGRTQALKMPAGLEEGNLKCDKGVKKKCWVKMECLKI